MKKIIIGFIVTAMLACTLCSCAPITSILKAQKKPEPEVQTAVDEIELDCYTATLKSGEVLQLNATYDGDYPLKWKSSDQDVALVNSKGTVTAIGTGVTNITCYTDNSVKAVCTITVTASENTTSVQTPTTTDSDFIFPHSSSAYLTEEEVSKTLSAMAGYSPSGKYSQDAINEIYARNGYVFQKPATSTYYNSQSWYTPDETFSTSDFNDYEKANIALLKEFL